jgi:hypothetical protein
MEKCARKFYIQFDYDLKCITGGYAEEIICNVQNCCSTTATTTTIAAAATTTSAAGTITLN